MRVIALRELKAEKGIPLHWQSINRLVREGRFPKPIHVGNKVAFIEEEIDAYLVEQMAKRDAKGGANGST